MARINPKPRSGIPKPKNHVNLLASGLYRYSKTLHASSTLLPSPKIFLPKLRPKISRDKCRSKISPSEVWSKFLVWRLMEKFLRNEGPPVWRSWLSGNGNGYGSMSGGDEVDVYLKRLEKQIVLHRNDRKWVNGDTPLSKEWIPVFSKAFRGMFKQAIW